MALSCRWPPHQLPLGAAECTPATISELNKKAYVHIEDWRNRPVQGGKYPYVYVDGTQWGNKKYMNMEHLEAALDDVSIAG